jgi:DNA polymerase-3 subunit epsilon
MLTQARDVSFTETATALEAALLEADEIKRLAPPFNVALVAEGRAVCFATPDLRRLRAGPDPEHVVGPLVSPGPVEALSALRAVLALRGPASLALRSRAVGVEPAYAPGPTCFAAGLEQFTLRHRPLTASRDLLRLGGRLWAARKAGAARAAGRDDAEEPKAEAPRRPAWVAERVTLALEETVVRATHAVRRGRWLLRLSESSLAWTEPGAERRRLLLIRGGAVAARGELDAGAPLPAPPGHARTPAERRAAFDVATFDQLRVLTTELRGLASGAGSVELRLGPHARLTRRRLQAVLRWV